MAFGSLTVARFGWKLTSPKNHQRRRVDMSTQLATELLDLRRRERARWLQAGHSVPDVVFASEAGTMLDEANVRHVYGRIVAAPACGI